MSECIGCDIAEQASMVCEICRGEKVAKATIAAQSEKIDLALIIIGEGKKNMCGGKLCMSYLKDIKEALEEDQP